MVELAAWHIEYLASQRLGRLATAGADQKPHVVPTSFRYDTELGTVDVGGRRMEATKKYRDVQANGWAAIVIDDLASIDPWTPRMLEIRGRAEAFPTGGRPGPRIRRGIYPHLPGEGQQLRPSIAVVLVRPLTCPPQAEVIDLPNADSESAAG